MTTSYTLTGDFNDLLGEEPRVTGAWLETNLPAGTALVDLDANKVLLSGPKRITLDASNTFSISLIATNSTGTNVTDGTLRYRVRAQYSDGTGVPRTWESGWFDLTAAADLSDKVGGAGDLDVTIAPSASLIDAPTAANVTGPSQTRTALDAAYARADAAPFIYGSKNGLLYDGTDETATLTAILAALSAYGGGTLILEGVVRCDGQINLPESGSSATQKRMAPLRITSNNPQDAPGSMFSTSAPYQNMPGLDLRYAGRTDAGCTTTVGSAFIGNTAAVAADRGLMVTGPGMTGWHWILHVLPGVGWVTNAAARATGTVSLTSFGGRIQALHYGTLEIDHLQLVSGGLSSAPFGLSTGPKVELHDNVFLGHTSKGGAAADEDPWVFGGPGQGTALTAALTSGVSYTDLTVAALPVAILSGMELVIGVGTATAQTVTTTAAVAKGATSIPVTSFSASANHGVNTSVYIGNAQNQTTLESWDVPSAPFQGYASHVRNNHFMRIRRIAAGGFTTDLYVDSNAWMHNCGSTLAQVPSTLTSALTQGTPYTSLAVTALDRAVLAGDTIQVGVGFLAQEAVASADAAAGSTSVSVSSFTPSTTFAVGTTVFNGTSGLGAMVESYAIGSALNAVTVTNNRMGFSGGYNYATRDVGFSQHGAKAFNNFQDTHQGGKTIAGHRFERNAKFNTVITGLVALDHPMDDRSEATGQVSNTIISGNRTNRFRQDVEALNFVAHSKSGSSAAYRWADTGSVKWQLYQIAGDAKLFLRDMVNSRMLATFVPGAASTSSRLELLSRLGVDDNLSVGAVNPGFNAMQKGVYIANVAALPSANPVGGGYLYVEAGALKYRGSSGTVTTIAPA